MDETDTGLVFVIDGSDYPAPTLDSLDMQERRVLYDLAGIVQEDFGRDPDAEDDDEHDERVRGLTRHPGFMEALMHIAYARGNQALKRDKVQAVIDRTNFLEALDKWADRQENDSGTDALPPAVTSELDASSPRSSLEKTTSSGQDSGNGSDEPAGSPEPTGAGRSDTSSRPSLHRVSAR